MTTTDIARLVTEREAFYADLIKRYDLRDVVQPPFYAFHKRDIAVALDKLERKCAA